MRRFRGPVPVRLICRARLGPLPGDVEDIIVEAKQLWIKIEVRLNGVVQLTTGVVTPGPVGIFGVRNVRSSYALFG